LHQGEASDGASTKPNAYDVLDLENIQKDRDNAIIDAQLLSWLNDRDKDWIKSSISAGRANQRTEVLLLRIGHLSTANRDSLQTMIKRKVENNTFLDSVRYEITATDDVSEWITFHNDSSIDVNINLDNGYSGTIIQSEFTRLMAHELLPHWWMHFRQFDKLKWKVIRDKTATYDYRLSDGLSTGSAVDSNRECSMGAGHERHNPEHAKVCTEQNSY
jgi:hypothetical protein